MQCVVPYWLRTVMARMSWPSTKVSLARPLGKVQWMLGLQEPTGRGIRPIPVMELAFGNQALYLGRFWHLEGFVPLTTNPWP